jgi:hypothetical protein
MDPGVAWGDITKLSRSGTVWRPHGCSDREGVRVFTLFSSQLHVPPSRRRSV